MKWSDYCAKTETPDMQKISGFVASPLWDELCAYLESRYGVLPQINYSVCSGAPGWNVKYRKSGRALCTLYPDAGFFTCLVSVGRCEAVQAELLLPGCTETLRRLYWQTNLFNGGRWLMIPVTSPEIMDDVKRLIALRVRKKQKSAYE